MTEQEFMRQVWRPYDTVRVIGDFTGAVSTVCFPTRSVKVALGENVYQWIKCTDIEEHISRTGNPDDMAIIEDLHNKLMAANKRNDDLQKIVSDQNAKIKNQNTQLQGKPTNDDELRKIRKALNKTFDTINSMASKMRLIDEYLTNLGIEEE